MYGLDPKLPSATWKFENIESVAKKLEGTLNQKPPPATWGDAGARTKVALWYSAACAGSFSEAVNSPYEFYGSFQNEF